MNVERVEEKEVVVVVVVGGGGGVLRRTMEIEEERGKGKVRMAHGGVGHPPSIIHHSVMRFSFLYVLCLSRQFFTFG